jgi:hypothetical protein
MPLIGVLHDFPGGKGVEVGIICIVVKPSKGTLYRLDWQGLLSCELCQLQALLDPKFFKVNFWHMSNQNSQNFTLISNLWK